MHLGAEVLALLALVVLAGGDETRHGVGPRAHFVDEVWFAFVGDLEAQATIITFADLHRIALLAHFLGAVLVGRTNHFGDEAPHMGPARDTPHRTQATLPPP